MNQVGRRAVLSEFQAREFAYGKRIYWLSRPAYANPAGVRAAFSQISGPAFAYGNRFHWLCGPAYANRAGARVAFSKISGPGSNTEKSDARSAVAFEHHFSLISYPILPLASAQRSAFEKTTYFFNTVLFSESLLKKSVVFF